MIFSLYQFIGVFIGIIAIILSILRFKEGRMSLGMLALWIFIWAAIIGISIYPESTNVLASLTGIGRGLDLILIIGLIGCYYLIFKIYTMIENIEKEITQLVREIALQKDETKHNIHKDSSDKR
ncbi:DUF2304 domain-containing protein [Methanobacterium sp. ACI-7]|uniref:DUF2304 domain-containing protein n=1 Tax=unclassified Methanobacterium TaxID=2627676 RepID=UPI0039C461F9